MMPLPDDYGIDSLVDYPSYNPNRIDTKDRSNNGQVIDHSPAVVKQKKKRKAKRKLKKKMMKQRRNK